jgi:peptide/nickel transport system permease protein
VLELRDKEFVEAARVAGRRTIAILFRVILPNALPALLVMAAVDIGRAILNFATLSFLGLGARPPTPEWGTMVSDGASVMDQWWIAAFPGLAILCLVFAFNLLGDSVRDALDPWIGGRRQ